MRREKVTMLDVLLIAAAIVLMVGIFSALWVAQKVSDWKQRRIDQFWNRGITGGGML